tara:strand:+ start:2500 stop:3474 length:975 start_codon:yes stop_codon:yes gene_type:complete
MKKLIYKHLLFVISKTNILVGGQAVMNGIMMRVPGAYATAVRNKENKIESYRKDFVSIVEKKKKLNLPIVRGMIHLYESLKIGFETLNWSADIAFPENQKQTNKIADIFMNIISISFAVLMFFILPLGLTTIFADVEQKPFYFNLISGGVRISIFIFYLLILSLSKEVQKLFQYHGAEHRVVYNFESGKKLGIKQAKTFPNEHPRCGTSFMFIIMIIGIITFSIFDAGIIYFFGEIKLYTRILIHIPLTPFVAGIGYEFLKITAKYRHLLVFKLLSLPGIMLQKITTQNPNDQQLEVGLTAIELGFGKKLKKYQGKTFKAEAIG